MTVYYPAMLNLEGRNVVTVGGGKVAERKVKGLLETGALVTVISPEATAEMERLSAEGKIRWKKKMFEPADLDGAFYIISATDRKEVNEAVRQAASPHQLLNLADNPAASSVALPSVVRRGKLVLAVSTSGASPKLAKRISRQLAESFDESYESYLDFLFEWREIIKKEVKDPKKKEELLTKLSQDEFFEDPDRGEAFRSLYKQETLSKKNQHWKE